jgi:hypothetical protein
MCSIGRDGSGSPLGPRASRPHSLFREFNSGRDARGPSGRSSFPYSIDRLLISIDRSLISANRLLISTYRSLISAYRVVISRYQEPISIDRLSIYAYRHSISAYQHSICVYRRSMCGDRLSGYAYRLSISHGRARRRARQSTPALGAGCRFRKRCPRPSNTADGSTGHTITNLSRRRPVEEGAECHPHERFS